jgi:hypothetical protein
MAQREQIIILHNTTNSPHLFGAGNDMHVWHAASLDGGSSLSLHWTQVPGGITL